MNMPFVREQGVGPGVVCFHSNCSSSGQFKELMDTLGSHFHVLAFDAYGAGKTPAWSRSTYLSLSDEVALAEAVMLQAGEPVILVGHSYGAAVALMMALANPARVQAVVVYEPTLFSLVNQVHAAPNGADAMRVVWKASAQAVENGDLDAAASMFIDFWSGEGTWANTPPRHKEAMLVAIRDVDRWGTAIENDPTPLSAFAELACPVLYMIGKDSPLPAHAVADVLVPVLPRVQVIEFEGIGHMGPITHPNVVNEAIVSFLNRVA
jgi:pimeloyl-ACP methyl ester carboxylesterase